MHLFNNSNWILAKKCRSRIFVSATSRAGAGIPKCAPDYTLPPCPMLRAVGLIAAFFGQEPHLQVKTICSNTNSRDFVLSSSLNIVKISSSVSTTPRTPPELGHRDCAVQTAGSGTAVAGRASTLQPTAEFSKLWGNIYTEAGFR